MTPHDETPDAVEGAGGVKSKLTGQNEDETTTSVRPLPTRSLPFDQTAVEHVTYTELRRRRRAYFELRAFLRDAA